MAELTYHLKIDATDAIEELNKKAFKVLQAVSKYIVNHKISCEEDIYQYDDVWVTAPELVEELANIVGYWEGEDDE